MFSIDERILLARADKLRTLAETFSKTLPQNAVYTDIHRLLEYASTPTFLMAQFEHFHRLAIAVTELASNQGEAIPGPSHELLNAARDFSVFFNGYGSSSRLIPNLTFP